MSVSAEFLDRLSKINLEPILYSLVRGEEGPQWSLRQALRVEQWYRRFHILMNLYPDDLLAPTQNIDKFWHHHILDTQKYQQDCLELHGKFIHHYPYFGIFGVEDEKRLAMTFDQTKQKFIVHFGESPDADDREFFDKSEGDFADASLCAKCRRGLGRRPMIADLALQF